ncbi:hypothetical protein L9F63_016795, partial [Diploptera punctata]
VGYYRIRPVHYSRFIYYFCFIIFGVYSSRKIFIKPPGCLYYISGILSWHCNPLVNLGPLPLLFCNIIILLIISKMYCHQILYNQFLQTC